MRNSLIDHWYRPRLTWLTCLLMPFSWLFAAVVYVRRAFYRCGILKSFAFNVPVIVVGNITVGGTGKTPLVIWMVNYLREQGYHPGIVSRGVGSRPHKKPYKVTGASSVLDAGDEPYLMERNTNCPVVIFHDRAQAVATLLADGKCDIVISDDGLQHYRLSRTLEVVVVDGQRKFGNQQLLPAGPLREPVGRIKDADMVIYNNDQNVDAFRMKIVSENLVPLNDAVPTKDICDFSGKKVHAIAGIGHPQRFFNLLEKMDMQIDAHPFPDHHVFNKGDVNFPDDYPVIMTEKDAVKCMSLAVKNCWYIKINIEPDNAFKQALSSVLEQWEKVDESRECSTNINRNAVI